MCNSRLSKFCGPRNSCPTWCSSSLRSSKCSRRWTTQPLRRAWLRRRWQWAQPFLHLKTWATVRYAEYKLDQSESWFFLCPRMKNWTGRATRARKSKQPMATTLTSPLSTTTWTRPTVQSRPPWRQSRRIHSGFRSPGCFREMLNTSHCLNIEGPCLQFSQTFHFNAKKNPQQVLGIRKQGLERLKWKTIHCTQAAGCLFLPQLWVHKMTKMPRWEVGSYCFWCCHFNCGRESPHYSSW